MPTSVSVNVSKVKLLQYANNLKIVTYLYNVSHLLDKFLLGLSYITEVSAVAVTPVGERIRGSFESLNENGKIPLIRYGGS